MSLNVNCMKHIIIALLLICLVLSIISIGCAIRAIKRKKEDHRE